MFSLRRFEGWLEADALRSFALLPFRGDYAHDKDHCRENPDDRGVLQRGHVVDEYHGCPEPLVHVVQRQYPGERLQEARHHLDGEEAPREEHHRKHDGVCRGGGALRLPHEAGEDHPDSDEGEDVKRNEQRKPGVYPQANVKHGVTHQQHRNRGYDREYELIQDVRQYPVGTGDGRGGQLPDDTLLPQLRVQVHRAEEARRHHRHRYDAGDEELDEPVFLREDRCLGRPDERRLPGHPLVDHGEHRVQDFHLPGHRGRAGIVDVRYGNGCVEVVAHHPLHEGPFVAFGNNEDKVQLVVLGVLRGVDGGFDPGDLELPVELEGLDELRRGVRVVEVLYVKVETHVFLVHENGA